MGSNRNFAARAGALITEMREAGMGDREIAALLTGRIRRRPAARNNGYLGAHVGHETVTVYSREAKRRNVPMSRLIARTLQCVASGKIFDAVLDTEDA